MRRNALLVGTLILVFAAGQGLRSAVPKKRPPDPGEERIAFYSSRSGSAQIYIMNPDGSGLRRLTTNSAKDRSPVISPDGSRIAFASDRDGASRINIMNVDGSGQRRLTNSADVEILPAWSPDGQRVFYQVEPKDGRSILYSASAGGGDVRRVTDGSVGFNYPAVSPDGRRIVCNGPDFSVYIMNVDGSGQRTVGTPGVSRMRPVWSPNGAKVAYGLLHGVPPNHTTEIGVMDADGGHDTSITRDGKRIAFQSCRDGNFEIYVMNADGSGVRRLTDDPRFDGAPSWGVVKKAS
jgi:TolB protein